MTLSGLAGALAQPAWARSSLVPGGQPADKFTILLAGLYKPVVECPDLGLTTVNVCDGTYTYTRIYPVSGLPVDDSDAADDGHGPIDPHRGSPIGKFYVHPHYCAYDLPGGALAMRFTGNTLVPISDGQGTTYFIGTIHLNIIEATGVYQTFVGGQNTMVDLLRQLPDGSQVEDCFCNISRP